MAKEKKMPPQLLEYFKNKNKKKEDGSEEKMSDKENVCPVCVLTRVLVDAGLSSIIGCLFVEVDANLLSFF